MSDTHICISKVELAELRRRAALCEEVKPIHWSKRRNGGAMSKTSDIRVLEISIQELSEAFDNFVGSCLNDDGTSKAPAKGAVMQARGCLPPACKHTFKRRG